MRITDDLSVSVLLACASFYMIGSPGLLSGLKSTETCTDSLGYVFLLKLAETLRNSPKLTETLLNSPKLTETHRNSPKLTETLRNSPKLTKTLRNSPKLSKTH
ncbi:adhesive plaque matrix protein [Plakobranchus ocellatus]|uniref:Adhesive plaque matrix protein n=1 Tax=Plakobranchus ocellatus TaxID=259542 RepID=A0AAV4DFK4_9GAST|nr:adhesive plaque matrix protein [Plakobranchus ocellatus]